LSAGVGVGTSRTSTTSGGPYRVVTAALIAGRDTPSGAGSCTRFERSHRD
jgi:hypothetical protein